MYTIKIDDITISGPDMEILYAIAKLLWPKHFPKNSEFSTSMDVKHEVIIEEQ